MGECVRGHLDQSNVCAPSFPFDTFACHVIERVRDKESESDGGQLFFFFFCCLCCFLTQNEEKMESIKIV